MGDSVSIQLLNIDSVDEQLKIHRAAFGEDVDLIEERKFWIKKHYENPLGPSLIFGAIINDSIVGMNAYMPVRYYLNGEQVIMLQSCESGVLPSCQGKGIWKKVVTYAIEYIKNNTDYKLVIGFPNYNNSYPGFVKMGWKTVGDMSNYVLVNNISEFKSIFHQHNPLFRFALNAMALQRAMCWIYYDRRYEIEDSRSEDLIWSNPGPDVLECDHSIELLEWKAEYKKLKSVFVTIDGKTVASCLYGMSSYDGSEIIKIERLDWVAECESKRVLACLLTYFAKKYPNVSFIRVWAQDGSKVALLLKHLLFVKSSHPNPFIVNNPESVYASMPWSLSFYDLD